MSLFRRVSIASSRSAQISSAIRRRCPDLGSPTLTPQRSVRVIPSSVRVLSPCTRLPHFEKPLLARLKSPRLRCNMSGARMFASAAGQPGQQKKPHAHRPPQQPKPQTVPGVKHIVAVASGKGGVGKSTTAVNLAIAMQKLGLRVGLLDADIYGPSLPRMMNLKDAGRPFVTDDKLLIPFESYNIKCMSMGFLVEEDSPMIWRGPMVMGAVDQLLRQVQWGELDVLLVDLPPGTGDAQLTLTQRAPLSGAVIVSTPQDIALIDARRGANMFRKVDVPILGIVQNMSSFVCPKCSEVSHIFGRDGVVQTAADLNLKYLGDIPLDVAIREGSDDGVPVTLSSGNDAAAKEGVHPSSLQEAQSQYMRIGQTIITDLSDIEKRRAESADGKDGAGGGPKFVIDE